MRRLSIVVLIAWAMLSLAGCAGQGPWGKKYEPSSTTAANQSAAQSSGTKGERSGAQLGGAFKGSPLDNPKSPLSKRTFYFDFNSSLVHASDRAIIVAHGRYLANHPNAHVKVEGNTDERGSREYNMALGERRAEAVAQILLLQGASKDQIQVISFGEEHPVALGHNEAAWRLNRRVNLVYSGN